MEREEYIAEIKCMVEGINNTALLRRIYLMLLVISQG